MSVDDMPKGRALCGRITNYTKEDRLQLRFEFSETHISWTPRYNLAPTQSVLNVVQAEGERQAVNDAVGTDPVLGEGPIDRVQDDQRAGGEAELPHGAEEAAVPGPGGRLLRVAERGRTQDADAHPASGEPFALAGLWDTWHSPDRGPVQTCTIITTGPNELMRSIHDRMPVILRPELEGDWLDPEISDADLLQTFLTSYPAEEIEAYAVSPLVNNVRNDSEMCLRPAA